MRVPYGWVIAGACFLMSVIGLGTRYSFGVFFKSLEVDFGMTRGMVSGFFSLYMLMSCVFAVLGGWAVDRGDPRKIIRVMGVCTGLSMILTSLVHTPWMLLFTYSLLLSMGTGPTFGVANSTTARWFVKKRGLFMGITASGGGLGAIVLAPFATYLISRFDWRTAFMVIGTLSGLVLIGISVPFVKDPRDMGLLPDGAAAVVRGGKGWKAPASGNGIGCTEGFSYAQAIRMRQFWLLALTWVFSSMSLHMIFVHVVPYAVDAGITPMDAALIVSLIGLSNIPGRLVVGRLSDAIGRRVLAVACPLLQCAALFSLLWAHELWMLYTFGIFFGFLWGGGGTMVAALVGDTFAMRNLGGIMGWMSGAWALGAAVGPAVGGHIFDVRGEYSVAFAGGAAALFISACLVSRVKGAPGKAV